MRGMLDDRVPAGRAGPWNHAVVGEADQTRVFEDRRWSAGDQSIAWRHRVALELIRAEPVCDVGGGDGLLLRMLRDAGRSDVRMVDLSPVAVEKARAAGFEADVGDALSGLPFTDGAFATVSALDVLEHVLDPLAVLRELARVGREVVVAVPNFNSLRARIDVAAGRVPFQNRPDRGHCFWFNSAVLEHMASQAGLRAAVWRVEPSARLGSAGKWLADRRPNLFGVSLAARFVRT